MLGFFLLQIVDQFTHCKYIIEMSFKYFIHSLLSIQISVLAPQWRIQDFKLGGGLDVILVM
jgi:hypothetical protein